ncbi:hypothetical protein [Thioalkalivibrio sp. ALE12]|uniref:hypothetical protein n=1 Tax=Thioalkalivibrio sp. ALE12 TaxID=1158170 RepID=UPI000363F86E|nr:hypothetical protein [Thioalkalivibrio sp. ALE12]
MAERKQYDWEAIAREYKAGQLSIREIGKKHGVTDGAIRQRAKRHGWKRDLSDEVRRQAKSQALRDSLRSTNASDEEIIEEAAKRGSEVIQTHRRDIRDGREIVEMMLSELKAECQHHELLSELAEQRIQGEDMDARAANAVRRAVSLPGRAGTIRDLSQSMQRLVALERQAYNLDEQGSGEDYEDKLKKLLEE